MKKIFSVFLIIGLFFNSSFAFGSFGFQVLSPNSAVIKKGEPLKIIVTTTETGVAKFALPNGASYLSTDNGGIAPVIETGNLYFGFTGSTKHSVFNLSTDENISSFTRNLSFSGGTSFSSPFSQYNYDVLSNSISVQVSENPKIISAKCFDENGNGKYDKLEMKFDKNLNPNYSTGFSILETSCNSGFGFSGNTTFFGSDLIIANLSECSNYDGGFTPKLSYLGGSSGGSIQDGSGNFLQDFSDFSCEDLASPFVITNDNISISDNESIKIDFSESLKSGSENNISLRGGDSQITGTSSRITSIDQKYDSLIFTPENNLDSSETYTLKIENVEDWAGNEVSKNISVSVSSSDNEAPVGASLSSGSGILILGGDVVGTTQVQLQISATDNNGISGMEMMISNFSDFSGGSWEPYKTSKIWDLISGEGIKNVYIKFRDSALNESISYSDSVELKIGNSYVDFDSDTAIYSDSESFTASGSCNYVSSTGEIISTDLTFSVNGNSDGTGTCASDKRWTHNFSSLQNTGNILKVEYTDSGSIVSQITVTKPSPSCQDAQYYTPPSNSAASGNYPNCNFTCNTNYIKSGNSCEPRACATTDIAYSASVSGFYGNCSVVSCVSGYKKSGNSCVLIPAPVSSGGGGGGGGGGGSLGPSVGNYVLPSSESDKLVEVFDNIDLKKNKDGILKRPLKIKELGGKIFVEILKGTKIIDDEGKAFNGKILAPKKISTKKLPKINQKTREIAKGKYALRAIKVGAENGHIFFDKDFKLTISVKGVSKKLDRKNMRIYSYNDDLGTYQIENKNLKFDEKTDSISIYANHMSEFVTVWEKNPNKIKENIGGGFENKSENESGNKCKIKDISNHWSKEFVEKLCAEGVVSGEGETGLFKPDNSINRAALLKMLMVSFGYKIESTFNQKYFEDVNGDERFANYVNTARKLGLIEGYKVKSFEKIKYTLQKGSHGNDVLKLQEFLTKKGFYNYTITGYFGGLTELALKKYQQSVGIMTSGILGKQTLKSVNSELEKMGGEKYVFNPGSFINRAEALTMILKLAGKIDEVKKVQCGDFSEFNDISCNQRFANYVKYGFEKGIISGKRKGIFLPSGNITKGEVSKIIVKTRGLK